MLFDCLPLSVCFPFFYIDVFNNSQWQCLSELNDQSIKILASRVNCHCIESTGTTQAYRRGFFGWKEFDSSKMEICAFPANLEHVALYL